MINCLDLLLSVSLIQKVSLFQADFFMRLFVNPKDHENAAQRRIVAQETYASSEKPTEGGAATSKEMAASSSTFDRSFPMQVWILFLREMVLRKRSAVAFQATIGRIIMFGIILGATFPNVKS